MVSLISLNVSKITCVAQCLNIILYKLDLDKSTKTILGK